MASFRVVDCSTHFGYRTGDALDVSLETLLEELQRHDIASAWTCSLRGAARLATQANEDTRAATSSHPELIPVATLDPRSGIDEDEAARCLANGVRAFRLFPHEQGWTIDSEPFERIVKLLGGHAAVLIVSAAEWGLATTIGRLTADRGIAVVLADAHYTQMAEHAAALQRWPHLYLLTNRLASSGAIEWLVSEVGSDRLVFGSDAPTKPLQCALNAVWFARISDAERQAIFASNADRLLGQSGSGGDRLAKAPPPPPAALVDVHAHVGPFPVPSPHNDEVESLQRNRQTFNIETIIASSTEAIGYDPVQGNRALARLLAEHAWLRGYVVCNPRDALASREALETYLGRPGFVGVKIHAQYSATPTASRPMWQLFEEIARFNCPVKIHNAGDDWVSGLRAIATTFESLKIVIAHSGPGAPVAEAVQLAATIPNVYLEFCTTYPRRGIIRTAVDQAGAEKVLFGSDQLLIDPAYVLGAYQDADLTESEWTQVGQTNARAVFDL